MVRVIWEGDGHHIEERLEPKWFGLWHRRVYYFCTPFGDMKFETLEEAEEMLPIFWSSLP